MPDSTEQGLYRFVLPAERIVIRDLLLGRRRRRRRRRSSSRTHQGITQSPSLLFKLLSCVLLVVLMLVFVLPSRIKLPQILSLELESADRRHNFTAGTFPPLKRTAGTPETGVAESNDAKEKSQKTDPYRNWKHFRADYQEMMQNLKIYVYPDVYMNESLFAPIFLPHPNPKKSGNYYSEHAFKSALLRSPLLTSRPEEAHFFYMPFSINAMRNDPRLHSVDLISDFVAKYVNRISSEFGYWNASGGADHLYVCCHSIGREAASKHQGLHNNAIQVTCSSSYFQRLYISHKDVALPQVWPRPLHQVLNPPDMRNKLVFFAGRRQNSHIREKILSLWGNDTSMDIFSGNRSFPYEEGFRKSKFCLHVKGYEVNTARISDAIHYGCIPIIISNHYDLPLTNVLDWSKFSIIISEVDVASLKKILKSVSRKAYLTMYHNLCSVRRHFAWHTPPTRFDSFYMTAYQLWLKRGLLRLSY